MAERAEDSLGASGSAGGHPWTLRPAVLAEYVGLGVNTVAGDARPTQRCG